MRPWSAGALTFLSAVMVLAGCQGTKAAPFPAIDRDKLQITLTRTACFGTCPDYKVTINGNGHVIFTTREAPTDEATDALSAHHRFATMSYVVAPGRHEDQIDPEAVDRLIEQFREAGFFSLKSEYSAQITDNPTYVLEIDTGHGRKKVLDYVGREIGMPKAVTDLEDAVDKAAGTARWVHGANGLVEDLQSEGFDFHSPASARILLAATKDGGDDTLEGLVQRGAPLEQSAGKATFGSIIILAAIENGRVPLFNALVERAWLGRTNRAEVSSAFASSAAGCSPKLVDAAVAAGVPVDATTNREHDERMASDGNETALASLGHAYICDNEADLLQTAERLLAKGADPNKRDGKGETALYGVENKEVLALILAHGANAKVVDNEGNSAVFGTWEDEIVLRLLQAGASPKGHYFDGHTLLEQMKRYPMPKAKGWLEAHPEVLALANSK